uniref:Uncharacterized protein n=1 Tax=Brassica campestris TaxID=3711 RepID=M4CJC1_BRACM
MLEKQKDIVLVIANNEMPHIDSHSFYTSLLTKDIPLIYSHPKSILSIMNVPNLTHREVARHLQVHMYTFFIQHV